jgi:hypothetical protein
VNQEAPGKAKKNQEDKPGRFRNSKEEPEKQVEEAGRKGRRTTKN